MTVTGKEIIKKDICCNPQHIKQFRGDEAIYKIVVLLPNYFLQVTLQKNEIVVVVVFAH